jgi:hypothetical protein
MRITIEFPFVERSQTGNKKRAGKFEFKGRRLKNELKAKCETFVYLAKKNYGIDKPFYGAVLNVQWHFKKDNRRDYDNFFGGTKYYTDALVSQEIILADDSKHLITGDMIMLSGMQKEKIVYHLELFDKDVFNSLLRYRKIKILENPFRSF